MYLQLLSQKFSTDAIKIKGILIPHLKLPLTVQIKRYIRIPPKKAAAKKLAFELSKFINIVFKNGVVTILLLTLVAS